MNRLITILAFILFLHSDATAQVVTNLYHTNRVFVATTSSIPGVVTAYKLYRAATQLTEIVGVTNVIYDTNATKAVEYEGFAWGYESANAAWTSAVAVYQSYYMNHTNMIYDNAGWVKGTREAYNTWGAFLWYLQNQIVFKSSATNVWISPSGGATGYFVKVYVGSIGDYAPMTNATDIGPTNWAQITNFLGASASTDVVYKANLDTYYQLLATRFLENTQQFYGFDSYSDPNVFYKSVEIGKTDTIFTQIYPTDSFSQVYFKSSNTAAATVSPTQAGSATQVVSITGGAHGGAELRANGGSTNGPRTGRIQLQTYPPITRTLAIRLVHEQNDDAQVVAKGTTGLATNAVVVSSGANGFRDTVPAAGDIVSPNDLNILAGSDGDADTEAADTDTPSTAVDLAGIVSTLNSQVFNQAVFQWNVTELPAMTVNFDLDRDGYLDMSSWMNAEMQAIRDAAKDDSYSNNIFLVNNSSVYGTLGMMNFGQRYGFVCPDMPNSENTIAHELGHGAFSLWHPDKPNPYYPPDPDVENLMHSSSVNPWRLRKNQWETINP